MTREPNTTADAQQATGPVTELLEPWQAAAVMGIDVDTLLRQHKCGNGPRAVRLGRKLLFVRSDAEEKAAREPERTPCPAWCDQAGRALHGYDVWTEDPNVWSRFHSITMPGGWCVSREETVRDGVSELGPVEVSYHGDEDAMTVEQARERAAALQAAIERAQEISEQIAQQPAEIASLAAEQDSRGEF